MKRYSRLCLPNGAFFPFAGVNYLVPPAQLTTAFSPDSENVVFRKGNVYKRSGYATMGGALSGTVMAIIPFRLASGVVKTVVITTTKEYVWNGTSWDNITLQVASVDVDKTGTTSNQIDWCVGTDNNGTWLFITNGVNSVRKWDGVSSKFVAHGFTFTGFTTCKCLAIYKGSLVLGNLAGDPTGLAWSDTNEFTQFETGNADSDILADSGGEILRVLPLADQLAVYSVDSIHAVTYTGGETQYAILKVVDNTRLLGPRAVCSVGPIHVYMSQENVFIYDGTRQYRAFGDVIQPRYRSDVYLKNSVQAHCFYDSIETTLLFAVPTVNNTFMIYSMELSLFNLFNADDTRWARTYYPNNPRTFGYVYKNSTLLWTDPIFDAPFSTLGFRWNQLSTREGFPQLTFGSGVAVYAVGGAVQTDAGVAVKAYYQSPDYTVPQEYQTENGRWLEVELEISGGGCQVQYSLDGGGTWANFAGGDGGYSAATGVFTPGTQPGWFRLFCDVVGKKFRIKVSDNTASGGFELKSYKVWTTPVGGW